MLETTLTALATVVVIAAVGLSVHYLAGLDWPWAIAVGAAVSIALRLLVPRAHLARGTKPPSIGE
jgi:hypothetical protein